MHGFEQISTAEFFFFFNVELQTYLERLFGVDKTKKKKTTNRKMAKNTLLFNCSPLDTTES